MLKSRIDESSRTQRRKKFCSIGQKSLSGGLRGGWRFSRQTRAGKHVREMGGCVLGNIEKPYGEDSQGLEQERPLETAFFS